MSNAYDEFLPDDDAPKEQTEGGRLRAKLEAAITALKQKDAEIVTLRQQNATRVVEDFLKSKEIPEKFHKLAKKELGDNPTEDALKDFVAEYGELWGQADQEPDPQTQAIQDGLQKMQAAAREVHGIKDNSFKMPSQYELAKMNPTQLAELYAQAQQSGPVNPYRP